MRSFFFLATAALIAASPAPNPQAFDTNKVAAAPATLTKGGPVGVGPTAVSNVYDQDAALANAVAAVTGATAVAAINKRNLEERTLCIFGICFGKQKSVSKWTGPSRTPTTTPKPTTATAPVVTSTPSNVVPSSCTPVSWTNTWAFTSHTACPSPFEVGTFCGFINPLDPCAPQPAAYGPDTNPDTPEAFAKNPVYPQLALAAKTPSGYVQTFRNLNASVNANSYLAYKVLESYDVAGCSRYCDETDLCQGFNIYIERDPAWNPDQCSCKNPKSTANYKCSIFGSGVEKSAAVNYGEWRDDFKVIIVASNGYQKGTPPTTPPGYENPQDCDRKLHDQPRYCLGQHSFPGPFDVSLCAAYAMKQNAINQKAGLFSSIMSLFGYNRSKCVQIQAAEIEKDGAAWGTHCRIFTKKFEKAKAKLDIRKSNPKWSCGKSYTFDIS